MSFLDETTNAARKNTLSTFAPFFRRQQTQAAATWLLLGIAASLFAVALGVSVQPLTRLIGWGGVFGFAGVGVMTIYPWLSGDVYLSRVWRPAAMLIVVAIPMASSLVHPQLGGMVGDWIGRIVLTILTVVMPLDWAYMLALSCMALVIASLVVLAQLPVVRLMAWCIGMYQAWMYEGQVEPSVTSARRRESAPVAPTAKVAPAQTAFTAVLEKFGVAGAKETGVKTGSVVERHYVELPIGTDTAKIKAKLPDIARAMKSPSIMIDRNAGNGLVAFDVPRKDRKAIMLDSVLSSPEWVAACKEMILPVVIGEFIDGEKFILDLPTAIHAIIAGTSGCGKSSLVNAILLSLMQSRTPDQVKLLLIDPKVVEFTDYANSAYLYHPVVTDMDKALDALNELVLEMEIRYQMMAAAGVKNIIGYQRLKGAKDKQVKARLESLDVGKFGSDVANHGLDMPYIVAVVDEFADLMAVSADGVEEAVARLGQKARASGIIDLLLTQRPSVDVITGLIKANSPTRFGLTTVSGIDSKTIIDTVGLEDLLSMGDMLYISPKDGKPKRAHSAYVPDEMIQQFMQ